MANKEENISEQLFKILKGFGHNVVLFTDDGQKTINPSEARRFYAKDIQMMVNYLNDQNTNEIVINLSKGTDIKTVKKMLDSIRTLATRYLIEYTVKTFGKTISPKDFAFMAKNTVQESSMDKRQYDRDQVKLAKLSKERNAAKKAGSPWKVMDPKEKEYYAIKARMNESEHTRPSTRDEIEADIMRVISTYGSDNVDMYPSFYERVFKRLEQQGKITTNDGKTYTMAKDTVQEGFSGWHGTARKSVNELGDARIVVRHKRSVDEEKRGARTRQIESIFIENADGERFKFPNKNVTAAKAMLKHVKEGGAPFDDFGQHIYQVMEELEQLKKFQRHNRRNNFFESEDEINEELNGRVQNLRKTLGQISGPKGYAHHFESFSAEKDNATEEQINELKDAVTIQYFDERIAESLPYVAKVINEFRNRQDKEKEIIDFAKHVMSNKDNIVLRKPLDIDDPESPMNQKFRDRAAEISAMVTYMVPHMKDDALANMMMQVSDTVFEVGKPHQAIVKSALKVIAQNGQVAETTQIETKTTDFDALNTKIDETFNKYSVKKLFS